MNFFREYFPRPETRKRFPMFSDKECCHIERIEYLLGEGQTFAEVFLNGTGMGLSEAIEQANREFYPPKRKRRAPLEVRGEGEGRHTMMMTEIAAMWDGKMDEDEFVIEALEKFKRPVVIDWGFLPEHLDAVLKLFDGGVMLWWFAADWAVARRKFIQRGNAKGPVAVFDTQLRKIEAALQKSTPSFAHTWNTHCLPPASTLHSINSGRACSTPWPALLGKR
jgi:hypothetical protein